MTGNKFRKTAMALFLSFLAQSVLADGVTDQAKTLIDAGKAKEAFALLDPVESTRAGDPLFDLLFGIAAIESGQNTRAVFALERVLAMQPNNARARAEIARAYLALGETATAKQEFETVQKQGVPPEVSATIDRFLDAVDRVDSVTRPTLRGYLEAGLGYDTNVNAATAKSSIAVPGFGGVPFTLADSSRAQDAGFGSLGGGLNLRNPLNTELAFVAGLSGVLRNNFGERQFDSLSLDAYGGLVFSRDKHVYSLTAQFNQYELASDRYRTAAGATGQWQYNLDARNQASAFVQYSDLRYTQQGLRNADRWVAGGAFAHAYRGGAVVFASAYGVSERTQDGVARWYDFAGAGVRLGGQLDLSAKTSLFASGSVEYRGYDKDDPSFQKTRRDSQYDLVVGANYIPARNWKITTRLNLTVNESNIELNKYRREAVSVTVRRDF